MKKIRKALTVCLVLLALTLCAGIAAACNHEDPTPEEISYAVVYDSQGGGAVKDGVYTPGKRFNLPTPSSKEFGFSFTGWYYESECENKATAELEVERAVDGKITLYAGWTDKHKINFDTKTSETIAPLEFSYKETISPSQLPTARPREVAGESYPFRYWVNSTTSEPVTEDFTMGPYDVTFHASYDTGLNEFYELLDDGTFRPVAGGDANKWHTTYRDAELESGEVFTFDMIFPANPSDYTDDCGAVFASDGFTPGGDGFKSHNYLIMFVTNAKDVDAMGGIQIWTIDSANSPTKIAEYATAGFFAETPYAEKLDAYKESGAAGRFTYTIRRVDNRWYFGVDGNEYFSVAAGETPSGADGTAKKIDESYAEGSMVGFRAKSGSIRYSKISEREAGKLTVFFDAGYGTIGENATLAKDFERGQAVGELPAATQDGYTFGGWFYYDWKDGGEYKQLTDAFVPTVEDFTINAIAYWKKDGAKPWRVHFDTGIEGYTLQDVASWDEGNALKVPAFSCPLYTFIGWYYDSEGENEVDLANFDITKADTANAGEDGQSFTLYAKWTKEEFLDGAGTQESPYLLTEEGDFDILRNAVNVNGESFAGVYFRIENDIDFYAFAPIGNKAHPFGGILDGNHKKLTGVIASGESYVGLFGALNGATVKDVTLEVEVSVTDGFVGGLAGYVTGKTTVTNVTVEGSVTGLTSVGGILGAVFAGTTIENCVNKATITATAAANANSVAGGIAGGTEGAVAIRGCENHGEVSANGAFVGGITGVFRAGGTIIENCKNFGNITGTKDVGGIVGALRAPMGVNYVYEGATVASNAVDTLPIYCRTDDSTSIGWLVGLYEQSGNITDKCGWCDEDGENITYQQLVVTFDAGEGSLKDGEGTLSVDIGEALPGLPVPSYPEHIFTGWQDGKGNPVKAGDKFDVRVRSLALTAQYEDAAGKQSYTVTLEVGEGTLPDGAQTTFTVTEDEVLGNRLPTPTPTGEPFIGWFDEEGHLVDGNTRVTGDLKLEARYGWNGQAAESFAEGSGSQDQPYRISTPAELVLLANMVNGGDGQENVYFELAQDIDVSVIDWTPIGNTSSHAFKGYFDGKNHKITYKLTGTATGEGLFGFISGATVKDLQLLVTITTTAGSVGGVAGVSMGGTISGVTVLQGSTIHGSSYSAGIVGYVQTALLTVENCENHAEITVDAAGADTGIGGGIVGASADRIQIVVTGCKNHGNVTVSTFNKNPFAGGIIGLPRAATDSRIESCINFGNITIQHEATVGGIAGSSRIAITNCYCYTAAQINGTAASELPEIGSGNGGYIAGTAGSGAVTGSRLCDERGEMQKVQITVHLDAGSGTLPPDKADAITVNEGEELPALPEPTWADHTFDGWFYQEEKIEAGHIFNGEETDITLTAQYSANDAKVYTVTLDKGEGDLPQDTETEITLNEDETLGERLPDAIPPEGKIFVGWYYKNETAVTKDTPFARTTFTEENVTLTAKYVSEYASGNGSQGDPYMIETVDQFHHFAASVNGGKDTSGVYFKLKNDLNVGEISPIGSKENPFKGHFDGGNFTLTYTIDVEDSAVTNVALFGYTDGATIENLKVHATVTAKDNNAGAIVGTAAGGTTVKNVEVLAGSAITAKEYAGGLVGYANDSLTIENCKNHANVTATEDAGTYSYAAGILGGSNNGTVITIQGCENHGTISGQKQFVGGIAGLARAATGAKIENCKNFGNITGGSSVGGIVGEKRVDITNCACYFKAQINEQYATTLPEIGSGDMGYIAGSPNSAGEVSGSMFCTESGEKAQITVTLQAGDGSFDEGNTKTVYFDYGKEIGSLPEPSLEGSRFMGWFYQEEETAITADRIFTDPDVTEISLTAHWQVIQQDKSYTIHLDPYGGTLEDGADFTVKDGEKLGEALKTPTPEEGNIFVGWVDENGTEVNAETAPVGDMNLTAKYRYDGSTVATGYAGGDGISAESAYEIATGAQLAYLRQQVAEGETMSDTFFKITRDLDLGTGWDPIGTSTTNFAGNFDGQDHTVTYTSSTNHSSRGLFGYAGAATIENLKLQATVVATSFDNMAAVVAVAAGTTIRNITVLEGSAITGNSIVGGIVGYVQTVTVTIEDCKNYATITATATSNSFAGGIVGSSVQGKAVVIKGCENYGDVSAKGAFVGGIVGLARAATEAKIENCKNFGNITGGSSVGGIVGDQRVDVTGCYCFRDAEINGTAASALEMVGSGSTGYLAGKHTSGTQDCKLCNESGEPLEE